MPDDHDSPILEPLTIVAAVGAIGLIVGATTLQWFNTHLHTNNLLMIALGAVIGLIPWLQTLAVGTDGVHITPREPVSRQSKIVDNLISNAAETEKAIAALQAQINAVARASSQDRPGLLEQIAGDKLVVSAASTVMNALSSTARDIYDSFVANPETAESANDSSGGTSDVRDPELNPP